MTAISDASPLISLSRIGLLDRLQSVFEKVKISLEVYDEVVVTGVGLPGSAAVQKADWIEVLKVQDQARLVRLMAERGLGAGETSTIILAKESGVDIVLMDEWRGRRLAKDFGLTAIGCVGILEELHRRSIGIDLVDAYNRLLEAKVRIDERILRDSLKRLGLSHNR